MQKLNKINMVRVRINNENVRTQRADISKLIQKSNKKETGN